MKGAAFRILGPLEVVAGGRTVDLGSPKQRAVLAILALEPNRAVSVDRLLDQLWGEEPPASALGSLHAYISNLRRILEPGRAPRTAATLLVSRAPGYLLAVEPEQLDSLLFEQLAGAGAASLRGGDADAAIGKLEAALSLWRGPVLADFAYETFIQPVAEALEERRRIATEDLIDARLLAGQHAAAVPEIEELVRAAPLRERAWGQLIVALYRCGRQADALRAYERARVVLADELGIDPGPALRRLERAVLDQDPDLDWPAVPSETTGPPGAYRAAGPPAADESRLLPIGRETQLEQLDGLLARLAGGRGGVVLVSGEPGVGKTTLLAELARRARDAGSAVGWGAFHEGEAALPLGPWADALREVADTPSPLELGALLGDERGDTQAGTVAGLMQQAVELVRRSASARAVVLVLDDIQWADELSHELLVSVIGMTNSIPLLLALGAREPVDQPSLKLIETRAALARVPDIRRFELTGLDQNGVEALTQRIAGEAAAPDVIRAMFERTQGNPFFVTELARLLSAQHALDSAERMVRAGVPVGARDVVRRRLARLPEQAVVMLDVASVIGSEVDARLLQLMTGIGIDELLDLMELAAVASLVSEYPERPGVYRFCHDLVREAIYDALPGLRRARLHDRAAASLIELHGDVPAVTHELARHSVRAVPAAGLDQAIPRLFASARLAQTQLSMDLAENQLRLGLRLLEEAPSTPERRRSQCEFESRLAQIQFLIRASGEDAMACLERACEVCSSDGPERLGVLTQRALLTALVGDMQATLDAADEAARLARVLGDTQSETDIEYCRAFTAWAGDLETARRAIDSSVTIAEDLAEAHGAPTGVHVPLACKLGWRSVLSSLAGEAGTAVRQGREAIGAAAADSTWTLSWTAAFVAFGAAIRGDTREVLSLWPDIAERSAGVAYTDSLLEACRAWAAVSESDRPDLSILTRTRAAQEAASAGLTAVPFAAMEADVCVRVGDIERAAAVLEEARGQALAREHLLWMTELDRISGNVKAHRGDLAGAFEQLTSALAVSEGAGIGLFACRARRDLDALAPRLVDSKSP